MCASLHLPSTNPTAPRQSKLALRQDQLAQAALGGEGCTLLKASQRAEPLPSLQLCFYQGWEAHWFHTQSHSAGQEGEERRACPLPALSFSMLRKRGCKKRGVRPVLWVSKYHFSVNQSFCSYTHTEPGNARLMDTPQLSLAPRQTAFYSTSKLHTENKQPKNWKEGRKNKTKTPQFSVFFPSDSLLRREVFRTFYPL